MKVLLENDTLTIKDLTSEQTELIMDSLVRFVNITLKDKSNDAATTDEEKIQLKADRKTAHAIYKAIETEHSKIPQI